MNMMYYRLKKKDKRKIKMHNLRHISKIVHNRFFLKANCGSIGIGLIGTGGWGASNAVNIMRSRKFNILGVNDVNQQAALQFADQYKVRCYSHLDDLLNNPNIQAVVATVPNHFHADIVKAAADAGKHVFMEKPLASCPDLCRELGQYCIQREVLLQVGHQMRRDPIFREIKRFIEGGVLGCPLYSQAVYTLDHQFRNDWRQDVNYCPGGSMEQLGVHLIDVLIYLYGLPRYARGWAVNIPRSSDAPDWAQVSMSFANKFHATVSTSFSSPKHMRLDIFFAGGYLVTDGQVLWIIRNGSRVEQLKPKGLPGSVSQFVEFADCIEFDRQPETGADQAAAVMEVVNSINRKKGKSAQW